MKVVIEDDVTQSLSGQSVVWVDTYGGIHVIACTETFVDGLDVR